MTQSLINEMYTLYFLFSREKSKHADHTLKFDGTTNRNKPQAPDVIYFTHKFIIEINTQYLMIHKVPIAAILDIFQTVTSA